MDRQQLTTQQIDRAIDKTINKFPMKDDAVIFTDVHFRVIQDSGELLSFDDDDNEINRCVIDEWIGNTDDDFYQKIGVVLRKRLHTFNERIDQLGISKPFSFLLEDDEKEHVSELYLVDDENIIIGGDLMENLDSDLDSFFNNLMKE